MRVITGSSRMRFARLPNASGLENSVWCSLLEPSARSASRVPSQQGGVEAESAAASIGWSEPHWEARKGRDAGPCCDLLIPDER